MFYDVFLGLCKEFNVTPAKVRKDLGISQSTMASWKSRNLTPNAQTFIQIAEYFHTTPAYLMGNKLEKNPEILAQHAYDKLKGRFKISWSGDEESHDMTYLDYLNIFKKSGELQIKYISLFDRLNSRGQREAVKRIEELTEIPRYQAPQPPAEPQGGTDTTPAPEGAEGPPEGK